MSNALQNRNLKLYFGGQLISLIGTWMQQMALSWLVYRLTNSTFMLGLIGFCGQVPSLLFTPFAGIVADRVNRHHVLIFTQALFLLQAALLSAVVLSGHPQLWALIALSALLGSITAFDMPIRQCFLVDMLDDRAQLASAMGLNASLNTVTRLIGPFIAGIVVSWAGEGMCFVGNAFSYVAVIAALAFVRPKIQLTAIENKSVLKQMEEGFLYTVRHSAIRSLITLLALTSLFVTPFSVLLPAFAKDILRGGPITMSWLSGATALGAVLAALFLTSRREAPGLTKWIIAGCALSAAGLIVLGLSQLLILSMIAVVAIGFGSMIVISGSNAVIQSLVDEDKRGRVMSFVVMAFIGFSPFGSVAAGSLSHLIGVGPTVVGAGLLTGVLAFTFAPTIVAIKARSHKEDIEAALDESESEISLMSA